MLAVVDFDLTCGLEDTFIKSLISTVYAPFVVTFQCIRNYDLFFLKTVFVNEILHINIMFPHHLY